MKFLESHGMKVTDDDAKTRSQKDKLEQLVSSSDDQKEELEDDSGEGEEDDRVETTTHNDSSPSPVPNVVRDGTMKVTAKVRRQTAVGLGRWILLCPNFSILY